MKTTSGSSSQRFFSAPTSVIGSLAILFSAPAVHAADTLAYSYETLLSGNPDGVTANGGGTYTQDTIGATHGTNSLKVVLGEFDTFVGAITSEINPTPTGAIIDNPPGYDHVRFDLTIAPGDAVPAGNFAVVGVTVFGCVTGCPTVVQRQFTPEVHIDGKAAGTYELTIDLTGSRPGGETFNEAFGPSGSDLTPVSFQLYFNKSPGIPLTAYIDNVRLGTAVPGDYNGNGVVDAADYPVWRKNLGITTGATLSKGDGDGDGDVDPDDYTYWRQRFGNISGSGSGLGVNSAVPEPGNAALFVVVGVFYWLKRRRQFML